MPSKKRGLNKGLNALLAETLGGQESGVKKAPAEKTREVVTSVPIASKVVQPVVTEAVEAKSSKGFGYLSVSKMSPGRFQPRRNIKESELEELADSIKSKGLLQPIVVRKLNGGNYEIVAGERRWRASQLAGLDRVPVVVKELSDEDACAVALVENIQRRDLNVIDEALGIERLIKQFDLTHSEVANALGKSRVSITNLLRMLNLRADVQKMLADGEIDSGHAKVLLAVSDVRQSQLARQIVAKGLSVRETEHLVNAESGGEAERELRVIDPDIKRLQTKLSEKLGAKVLVQHNVKGKGKLVIHYNNLEILEGILSYLE